MLKAIFVACLLATSLTWSILKESKDQLEPSSSKGKKLNFGNYTASGVTSNQISVFQQAVTTAGSLYGGNVPANLGYITNYLNLYGGISTDEFFVFIETSNLYTNDWYVYSYGNVLATFTGINPYAPSWSYMFLKGQVNKSTR
jgi:hypothetical protein